MSCGGSSLLVSGDTQPGVALVVAVGVAGVSVVRMLALAVLVTRCPECCTGSRFLGSLTCAWSAGDSEL